MSFSPSISLIPIKYPPLVFRWISICFLVLVCLLDQNVSFAQQIDTLRISENFVESPLVEVIDQLEKKYNIPFYYKKEWVEGRKVNSKFDNELFVIALGELLKSTELSFAIFNNNSVIIAPTNLLSKEFSQEYFIRKDNQQKYFEEENWPSNIEIVNLGSATQQTNDSELTLETTIIDGMEGDLLVGALVRVKDLDLALSSNIEGKTIIQIPPGLHVLEISMLGYETLTVGVNLLNSATWNIELLTEATELDEVLVSATADDSNIKSTVVGMAKLSAVDIKEMPVFLGEPDVIKSILTLPGVSTIGEGASGFNVRGGNIDQNLVLQDGSLLFNSSHAMGFFSVFNPDVIRDVTLYKGHIPAQFGGRVSSVLDVKLKGNNYDKLKVNGGIGMLASRVAIETPIIKDKISLLLGGRIAYSDWVLNLANKPAVKESSLSFYDINAKISQRLGEKGTIALSVYNSKDQFVYSQEFGFSWKMTNISLNWNQVFSPKFISEFTVTNSRLSNTTFQPTGVDAFILGNGMNNYKIKEDLLITKIPKNTINVGAEVNSYFPNDETFEAYNPSSTVIPYTGQKDKGLESAIYINDAIDLSSRLSISIGLRYSFYSNIGPGKLNIYEKNIPTDAEYIIETKEYDSWERIIFYQDFDPRASLVYQLNTSSSLKMSYNHISQYIHLISNTTAALPIDYWQVSNTYFKPIEAVNYSLGYFKNFKLNQWETSIEAYYRTLENIIEYKDFPELYLNDHLETELLSGQGKSYGLELYIKRKTGKLNGWISYTYSRTFNKISDPSRNEEINRGEWFPSKFDQPHNLNLVGNLNFNKTNQLSFNFTFATGRPITGPDSNYAVDGTIVPNFSDRNEYRIPNYHRLDVSYTIQRGLFRTSRYNDSFTISIYNLYARKNAYSIYFKRSKSEPYGAYKLSILGTMLPSFTYNFNF